MRRALPMVVLLALAGCKARFDPEASREYKCSADGGADQCPGHSVCNVTAGFCIDLDAGQAFPCSSDLECGHGWRCGIAKLCVDAADEPALATVDLVESTKTSPAFDVAALFSSQATIDTAGHEWFDLVIRQDAGPLEWVWSTETFQTVSVSFDLTSVGLPDLAGGVAATNTLVQLDDAGTTAMVHALFQLAPDGGAMMWSPLAAPTGDSLGGPFERLLEVRTSTAFPSTSGGAVGLVSGTDVSIVRPGKPPFLVTFQGTVNDLAWLSAAELGQPGGQLIAATSAGIEILLEADGGRSLGFPAAGGALDLRLRGSELLFRTPDGVLHDAVPGAIFTQRAASPVCPGLGADGGSSALITYGLDAQGRVSQLCRSQAGDVTVLDGVAMPNSYQVRTLTTQASDWWAWNDAAQVLTRAIAGTSSNDEALITPFRAPESIAIEPQSQRTLLVDGSLAFRFEPGFGFSTARVSITSSSAVAAIADTWVVTRNGSIDAWAGGAAFTRVAASSVGWKDPAAPVLVRALPVANGDTALVVAHDDTIDVAELVEMTVADLAPRVLPSPGLAVRDLALRSSPDGGFAEGFAVAGGNLVALAASTPRRWSTSRVALPGNALHVWYEGASPRVVLDDGTIVGLSTGTVLFGPSELDVVDAITACPTATSAGTPLLLATDGVEFPTNAGWLPATDLPANADFARGRLFATDGGWLVFDSRGSAWAGACP